MGAGLGISLIVIGAIFLLALTGSPHWLNLRIVGIVLIAAGTLGMALPGRRKRRASVYPDRMSRWVLPGQFPVGADPAAETSQGVDMSLQPLVRQLSAEDPPTLADDVLELEHDPPL